MGAVVAVAPHEAEPVGAICGKLGRIERWRRPVVDDHNLEGFGFERLAFERLEQAKDLRTPIAGRDDHRESQGPQRAQKLSTVRVGTLPSQRTASRPDSSMISNSPPVPRATPVGWLSPAGRGPGATLARAGVPTTVMTAPVVRSILLTT